MSKPPTIVFQAFATSWLGHTSRLIAIAQGIRRRNPDARLLFLADGNPGVLLEMAGFAYIALPPESALAGPEWNGWPGAERDQTLGEMTGLLLDRLEPNLIVYDSRACSYVVEQSERRKIPTVFIARRSRHAARSIAWAREHHEAVDLVIVPHNPGEIPVPPELEGKMHFVGTIVRDAMPHTPVPSRSAGKQVLITGGGGGFPGTEDFYSLALAATSAVREQRPELRTLLVAGPMFRQWEKLGPVERVTIIPFDADLQGSMARADVVICQAGYNTIAELGTLSTPTLCVPAPRVADDQFARARQTAALRQGFTVMTDCTVEAMRDQILRCLDLPRGEMVRAPHPPGADRAAELILSLCA